MENKSYEKVEIILNEKIADGIYKMDVKGEFKARVGQFYMVKCFEDGNMLPRPISICDIEDNKLTFLCSCWKRNEDYVRKESRR